MSEATTDAVVVGSGPNGLTAAVVLAQAGCSVTVLEARDEIGGGTRSAELTVPGVVHDVCSAAHPFAVASPAFSSLPLADHGLEWRHAAVALAHPLDGGRAAALHRSVDHTAAELGQDERAWRRVFGHLVRHFEDIAGDVLGPMVSLPHHPLTLSRFGVQALLPAPVLARQFRTDEARALFAGNAAHAFHVLGRPGTSAPGLMLVGAGHHVGWPVARGGSQAVAGALASHLQELGGVVKTGVRVTSLDDLPPAQVTLFDTSPSALARIAGGRLPARVRRLYTKYRHGPAAFKVDLAVEGGIPWTAPACHEAGTLHLGGTLEEIAHAEAQTVRGRMPERPFVLVGQQYLADPSRSRGEIHPIWTYAHVPAGYGGDATGAVLDQIERFAPGFRDRIVGTHVTTPAGLEAYNPNFVNGDISTGANNLRQMLLRPRAVNPYDTGIPGMYLCSAATPPGAGVHGMCGYNAARRALTRL